MGAYSTLRITESKAKHMLLEAIQFNPSKEALEKFMNEILEPRLYNAIVVPDHAENDDSLV